MYKPPPLETFIKSLIFLTPIPLTPFQSSLKSFLSEQRSLHLKDCKTPEEIIEAFNNACSAHIQRIITECLLPPSSPLNHLKKQDSTSSLFRSMGNDYYKTKDLEKAIRCYTLAISFAPHSSKSQALGYSNRSACHYEQGNIRSCLSDIKSFQQIWPSETDEISSKISSRKSKCHSPTPHPSTLINKTFCANFFQLKSANRIVPSAEDTIGIKTTDERGRHVVNTSASVIPPGRLLILEPPYKKILLRTYAFEYLHCTECLGDLQDCGIPCETCVFATYCSSSCSSSRKSHPPSECTLSRYLYELKMDRTVYLSLSILLTLTPTDLLPDPPSPHPLGFSESGIYDSSTYPPIKNLIYHMSNLSESDLFEYSLNSTILSLLISTTNQLHPLPPSSLQTTLLLHQMNLPTNAHSLYKLSTPPCPTPSEIQTSTYTEIGAAAFPLLSLLNHSCSPNVIRITLKTGLTAVISLENIPPNTEILDNYGTHFATQRTSPRKSHLSSLYNFTCTCPPCTENWPTIETLITETSEVKICQSCRTPLSQSTSKIWCPNCKTETTESCWSIAHKTAISSTHDSESHLLKNNPTASLTDSISALTHFSSTLKPPSKHICIAQEYMKQSLFLITRDLFT